MKLDIDFSELEKLVKKMSATPVHWESDLKITVLETDWKIDLETKGIDVDIEDIDIQSDGLLKYRGEQILLYIKEVTSFGEAVNLPKFHFYQCRTLLTMHNRGRFERYVVTQRKTGYFLMDRKIGYNDYEKDVEEKLDVCKNCLNWFNKNYRKHYAVDTFNIVDFFENFPTSLITNKPTHTDLSLPVSGYSDDWEKISAKSKEDSNYICQQCNIDLINNKNLLQTHHVNGVKSDNSAMNLKVLCVECHSEQPNHGHIKANKSREILDVRRLKSQNKYNRSLFETIFETVNEVKDTTQADNKIIHTTQAEDKSIPKAKINDEIASQISSFEGEKKETSKAAVQLLKDENTKDFEDMF
jgi:hypothetical protein